MKQYDKPEFFAAYAQMDRSKYGLDAAGEWPQMKKLLPDPAGKRVLDLGCGYGWHCRWAFDRGAARVLGLDAGTRMIDQAKSMGSGPEYMVCDLLDYGYPPDSWDLVISNLVLHYVADLEPVFRRIYETLAPGGVFVMNIEHPVFTACPGQRWSPEGTWPVTDYFYPGLRETDFLGHPVLKQHHTLTDILMGLRRCGFRLEAVEEVMPPEAWRPAMPEEMRRPMMLLVRAEKERL